MFKVAVCGCGVVGSGVVGSCVVDSSGVTSSVVASSVVASSVSDSVSDISEDGLVVFSEDVDSVFELQPVIAKIVAVKASNKLI